MADVQLWIVATLARLTSVRAFMHTPWGWPAMESLHFIGLSMLVGTIFVFDLRLLGVARQIPIAALHRLVPWAVVGYFVSLTSGALFLIAEPDQYVYNPAFQFKVLFMTAAGLNAGMFYLTAFRRTIRSGSVDAPRRAKIIALLSIGLWLSVIVAGRLLTFYRPWPCGPSGPGVIAECIPGYEQ